MYTPTSARSGGLGGLLGEAHDASGGSRLGLRVGLGELGDAVVLWVGHGREQDQRVRRVRAERSHQL